MIDTSVAGQVTVNFDLDKPSSKFMSAGFDLTIPDGAGPGVDLILSPFAGARSELPRARELPQPQPITLSDHAMRGAPFEKTAALDKNEAVAVMVAAVSAAGARPPERPPS